VPFGLLRGHRKISHSDATGTEPRVPNRNTGAFSLIAGPAQIPYVGMAQQYTESAYLLAVGCKHTELENRALTAQVLSLKLPVQHP